MVVSWRQSFTELWLAGRPWFCLQQASRCWNHFLTTSSGSPTSAAMRMTSRSEGFRLTRKLSSSFSCCSRAKGGNWWGADRWAWIPAMIDDWCCLLATPNRLSVQSVAVYHSRTWLDHSTRKQVYLTVTLRTVIYKYCSRLVWFWFGVVLVHKWQSCKNYRSQSKLQSECLYKVHIVDSLLTSNWKLMLRVFKADMTRMKRQLEFRWHFNA